MLQTRIVPWINYEEFETVYHWLFADRKTQSDTIQLGIDRVNWAQSNFFSCVLNTNS